MRVKVREMLPGEAARVADLVARVFEEHVAPLYGPEGWRSSAGTPHLVPSRAG